MAAVAVAGVASAQVTITGAIGYGLSDTNIAARSTGWTDGKVVFSANEDLGGGMSIAATMQIESYGDRKGGEGVNAGGQSITFTTANAGKLTMSSSGAARDDLGAAPSLPYDSNTLLGGTLDSYNVLQYDLPTIVDGLSIGVRMTGGGSDSASQGVAFAGNDKQLRFGYNLAGAALTFNTKSTSTGTASSAGLTYDIAGVTVKAVVDTSVQTGESKKNEYSISMPVGGLTLAASKMTEGTTKSSTEVGATLAMSKRTSVTFGMGSFEGGTTKSANRLRLVHTF